MPTINKRFLLKLVLVLVVSTGGLFSVHAIQAGRIPEALKRQSERSADAGKTDTAIHYLRQYLEFKPDDIDAQITLVELLKKRTTAGRPQSELIFLYDRILRIDPERHAMRREALTACLKMGRYSDAVTHAEFLLKVFPTEPALWQQLAAAQTGLHELSEARKSYEMALTLEPEEIAGYQRLAQLVWKNMNDPPGARAVLDRMVKAAPQSPEAHLIRARFETFLAEDAGSNGRGDLARAAVELHRVLELDPEHAEASLLLADMLQRDRKIPAAHAILRDLILLYPRDLRVVRSLSWLELILGNAPSAIAVLEDGLKRNPDAYDLLIPLADLLVQQGDTTRTAEIVKRLETRKAPPPQVKYLKARLAMRDAKWADAVALLEALRSETHNLPALETQLNLLLAVCATKVADPAAEEKAYQRVLSADPKNVQARVGFANLLLTLGKFDDATRELEVAAQSPYAGAAVITQYIRTKTRRLRTTGGSPQEWQKLEQTFKATTKQFGPASSEPILLFAEIGIALGKTGEVVQLLRKESATRPGDSRLWAMLAEATADLSGTALGLAVLDEGQAAAGDNPDIRLARAKLYASEPGLVRPLSAIIERTESWPEAEQLRLLFGMVEVFDQVGDHVAVAQTLRALAGRRPSDTTIWWKLHERSLRTGDIKTAAEARAALVKLEGETGESVLLCDAASATPVESPKVLSRVVAAFGENPARSDACSALARLHSLAGNEADAAKFTERAFTIEPTRYDAAKAWLIHLCGADTSGGAQSLLTRLATDPRWTGDPFRRLIANVIPKVQMPVAVKLLNWTRPFVERDPGGLGWLAAVASANRVFDPIPLLDEAITKKTASADDYLRLAVARKPTDLLVARGKVPAAAYLGAAAILLETPAGKDFAPGVVSGAERRLFAQARLAVKLSRNEAEGAMTVLQQFLAAEDLPRPDAAWGRRNLAMLYAVGGTAEDRKKAMELLKNVEDGGATVEEYRATASVLTTLSRYLEGADRVAVLTRAALALDAAYKAANAPIDLYNLSQLYRAAGNRVESRKRLQVLLNSDQTNLDYLIAAIEELVEDQTFAAAETFTKQLLASKGGTTFRAVATAARFECKRGRPDAAMQLAEKYTRDADPTAGDHLARAGRVAELLDELARLPNVRGTPTGRAMCNAAAERYASLIPTRSEAVVGLVGVLAIDGRATDAFARVEQFARYLPARVRASAGLAIIRAGGVTDRQAATVLEWLDACLKEEPASPALMMNRAEFMTLRQDLTGAAVEYEKVIAAAPRNAVALNNLAWILAADPRTAERAQELVARATREVGLTGDLLDTRARVRITLKQFAEAERDLNDAIRLEPTPLRWFHLAVSRLGQTPARTEDAANAFREAKRRGLEQRGVHPADRPTFDALDVKKPAG